MENEKELSHTGTKATDVKVRHDMTRQTNTTHVHHRKQDHMMHDGLVIHLVVYLFFRLFVVQCTLVKCNAFWLNVMHSGKKW